MKHDRDELLFHMATSAHADDESERIEAETAALEQEFEIPLSAPILENALVALHAQQAIEHKKLRRKQMTRKMMRAVGFILAFGISVTALVFNVEAWQVAVANFLIEKLEQYTGGLEYDGDEIKIFAPLNPFDVSVSESNLVQTQTQIPNEEAPILAHETEDRLVLTVSINNQTGMDFRNVHFELLLNEEVEPYIASKLIKFTSDPMDVTTSSKAQADNASGKPLISGFLHEWSMLLTTGNDLKTYYGLAPEGIIEALKSITVNIQWDGGSQSQTIPLSLKSYVP